MRIIALFRVSTEKQLNEGASLDAQQRRFRELADQHGWSCVAEFRGQESAAKAGSERLVLGKVLACIREQAIDAIWIYEQSRLTRGDELEVALLVRELRERQVRIVVDSSFRDLGDINDNLAFGFQSLIDRAEWQRFKERVARGKREKARQGKRSSGKSPYGYMNPPPGNPDRGTLQIVPEQAAIVRRIFERIASGTSIRALCRDLNAEGIASPRRGKWGKTTIRNMLNNPTYTGVLYSSAWVAEPGSRTFRFDPTNPNVIMTEDAHEPIISPSLKEAARSQVKGNSTGLPGMLTGMLRIEGRPVNIDFNHGRSYYKPATGYGPWVDVREVNGPVWDGFFGLIERPAVLLSLFEQMQGADQRQDIRVEIAALQAQQLKMQRRLGRLVDMRADGEITRQLFLRRSEEHERTLRTINEKERDLKRRLQALDTAEVADILATAQALSRTKRLSLSQKRRAMRLVVSAVDISISRRKQPRTAKGYYAPGKKPAWKVEDVFLRLHQLPPPDTTLSDSDHRVGGGGLMRACLSGVWGGALRLEPATGCRDAGSL